MKPSSLAELPTELEEELASFEGDDLGPHRWAKQKPGGLRGLVWRWFRYAHADILVEAVQRLRNLRWQRDSLIRMVRRKDAEIQRLKQGYR